MVNVTFKKVPDRSRSLFPGRYFDDCIFDCKVFNVADRLIVNYDGGYWDYMLSDCKSVAYMQPGDDNRVLRNPSSGEQIEVPGDIAGMIVTSFAMLIQIEGGRTSTSFDERWEKLNDAIRNRCVAIDRSDIWMTMMD